MHRVWWWCRRHPQNEFIITYHCFQWTPRPSDEKNDNFHKSSKASNKQRTCIFVICIRTTELHQALVPQLPCKPMRMCTLHAIYSVDVIMLSNYVTQLFSCRQQNQPDQMVRVARLIRLRSGLITFQKGLAEEGELGRIELKQKLNLTFQTTAVLALHH